MKLPSTQVTGNMALQVTGSSLSLESNPLSQIKNIHQLQLSMASRFTLRDLHGFGKYCICHISNEIS